MSVSLKMFGDDLHVFDLWEMVLRQEYIFYPSILSANQFTMLSVAWVNSSSRLGL